MQKPNQNPQIDKAKINQSINQKLTFKNGINHQYKASSFSFPFIRLRKLKKNKSRSKSLTTISAVVSRGNRVVLFYGQFWRSLFFFPVLISKQGTWISIQLDHASAISNWIYFGSNFFFCFVWILPDSWNGYVQIQWFQIKSSNHIAVK